MDRVGRNLESASARYAENIRRVILYNEMLTRDFYALKTRVEGELSRQIINPNTGSVGLYHFLYLLGRVGPTKGLIAVRVNKQIAILKFGRGGDRGKRESANWRYKT